MLVILVPKLSGETLEMFKLWKDKLQFRIVLSKNVKEFATIIVLRLYFLFEVISLI